MRWSGKPFVPLHKGKLGKPTREAREAAPKQTPTSNTTSICRRVRGTYLVVLEADRDENA
jgi:hypothetical protein